MDLYLAQPDKLNYCLSKFVLEARKENGENYPPSKIYSICCGLLRYVREIKPAMNFFKDPTLSITGYANLNIHYNFNKKKCYVRHLAIKRSISRYLLTHP